MLKLKQNPIVIKTDIRSKFKNSFKSNGIIFFQIARSSRKKSMLLWFVTITAILGLFLVSWLFNSNSLPLDIGNMPIKQVASDYELKGKFVFVDKNMEVQRETLKKKGEDFIEHCVKFISDKTDCENTWAIVLKDIEKN